MYNEIFANYDVKMFNSFVEKVKKEQGLKSKAEDLVSLIIDALKEEAMKKKNGSMAAFGIDDKTLTKAIIKADSCMAQYLKSKEKKTSELPTNKTVGDKYYDKKGQKHTKKSAPKAEKKKSFEKFDLSQLELFDFE